MKHVAILIPASPVAAFFSQLAAFSKALKSLRWSRWQPSLHVVMGGGVDTEALQSWLPYLDDVAITLLPRSQCVREGIWAQYDGVFSAVPADADVMLRMDADTLPVDDFQEVLDRVADAGCVAGVIAHGPFRTPLGWARVEDWERLAQGLISTRLDFAHQYTLVDDAEGPAPFYVNFGAVFFPRAILEAFKSLYLRFRPELEGRLPDPYFAGQVAFTLAIAELGASGWALPLRYNFPNDDRALSHHPDELAHASIFHYLRTEKYDRHRIFTNPTEYNNFMRLELTGVDCAFQQKVKELFGFEYPFGAGEFGQQPGYPRPRRHIDDPLSSAAFETAKAEHERAIAPALVGIDAEGISGNRHQRPDSAGRFQGPLFRVAAPKISVVLPVHNKGPWLAECIGSILSQTFQNFELICIDDFSSDDSFDILCRCARDDHRMTILRNEQNLGPGPSRNIGIQRARGEYLRMVDADDLLPSTSLECLYDLATRTGSVAVRGSLAVFPEGAGKEWLDTNCAATVVSDRENFQIRDARRLWLPWFHVAYLFSRPFVTENKIEYPALRDGEDPVFLASILVNAPSLSTVSEPVYFYRTDSPYARGTFMHVQDYLKHISLVKSIYTSYSPQLWLEGCSLFYLQELSAYGKHFPLLPHEWEAVIQLSLKVWTEKELTEAGIS